MSAVTESPGDELALSGPTISRVMDHDVYRWRREELERAGFDFESAITLAASADVDLHEACGLLHQGCSIETALRILL